MPLLRLAYAALFLIALIAVFVTWSQVGGQGHLDLLPWFVKAALGAGVALAAVKATAAAVADERPWNVHTLRWLGLTLALAIACGVATYYSHLYLEESDEGSEQGDTTISSWSGQSPPAGSFLTRTRGDSRARYAEPGAVGSALRLVRHSAPPR